MKVQKSASLTRKMRILAIILIGILALTFYAGIEQDQEDWGQKSIAFIKKQLDARE